MVSPDEYISLQDLNGLNGLQLIQINIRSLYHKLPSLVHTLITPSMDIIGVTETWLNEQIPNNLIDIPGFSIVRNDRTYGRGGGTCLYIRHGINYVKDYASLSNRFFFFFFFS